MGSGRIGSRKIVRLQQQVEYLAVSNGGGADTYKLTFDGQTTAPILETATGAQIQTALELLSNITAGDVTVTGAASGPYEITWAGNYLGQSLPGLIVSDETGTLLVSVDTLVYDLNAVDTDALGTAVHGLDILGNYMAVAMSTDDAILVFDITDPAAPVQVGDTGTQVELNATRGIWILDDTYVLAIGALGDFVVVDWSTKTLPVVHGHLAGLGATRIVVANAAGSVAYVPDDAGDTVYTINLADKANPVVYDSVTDATNLNKCRGCTLSEDEQILYVGAQVTGSTGGVTAVDVSSPAAISVDLAQSMSDASLFGISGVTRDGDYLVTGGVPTGGVPNTSVLRILASGKPQLVGAVDHIHSTGVPEQYGILDGIAAVSNDGVMTLVDISVPALPKIAGEVADIGIGGGVASAAVLGQNEYVYGTGGSGDSLVTFALAALPEVDIFGQLTHAVTLTNNTDKTTNKSSPDAGPNGEKAEESIYTTQTEELSLEIVQKKTTDAGQQALYLAAESIRETRIVLYDMDRLTRRIWPTSQITGAAENNPHDAAIRDSYSILRSGSALTS